MAKKQPQTQKLLSLNNYEIWAQVMLALMLLYGLNWLIISLYVVPNNKTEYGHLFGFVKKITLLVALYDYFL